MQGVSLMCLAFCIGASELFLFYRESELFYQLQSIPRHLSVIFLFAVGECIILGFNKMCNEGAKKVAARRLQLVK